MDVTEYCRRTVAWYLYAVDKLLNVLVAIAILMNVMPSALWRPPKATTVPVANRGIHPAPTQQTRTRAASKHFAQAQKVGGRDLQTEKAYVVSHLIHQALIR